MVRGDLRQAGGQFIAAPAEIRPMIALVMKKGDNMVARLTVAWQLDFEQALNSSDLFETLPDR